MRTDTLIALVMFMSVTLACQSEPPYKYAHAKKVDQVDDFFGTKIADPYRWLEDSDARDTRAWIDAQNGLTSAYLKGIPERERIGKALHDGVIQSIYAVGLSLEDVPELVDADDARQEAVARVDRAIDALNLVIADIRSYILRLRPPARRRGGPGRGAGAPGRGAGDARRDRSGDRS